MGRMEETVLTCLQLERMECKALVTMFIAGYTAEEATGIPARLALARVSTEHLQPHTCSTSSIWFLHSSNWHICLKLDSLSHRQFSASNFLPHFNHFTLS